MPIVTRLIVDDVPDAGEREVVAEDTNPLARRPAEQFAPRLHGEVGVHICREMPIGIFERDDILHDRICDVQQPVIARCNQNAHVSHGVTRRINHADAGHDFSFLGDELNLIA